MLWFKAFHLIGMVTWFAGLFYMFRLFVYHAENKDNKDITDLLKVMEMRLYKYITMPSMYFTVINGSILLYIQDHWLWSGWMHVKLVLIVALIVYTAYINRVRLKFKEDNVYLNSKQCRIRNEWPTPLLIIIILLAVFKPF
ncbi:MAG: protoporphyrinogen oxidase HemJ [Bdellovibrionales bacterium]|nr:protoporphyrinogen oxidase HemJ [Bdellovibrionales bacterium]